MRPNTGPSLVDTALRVTAWLAVLLAVVSLLMALAERSPGYAVGDRLDIPGVDNGSDGTLVLWLDSACQPCVDSMTFYRRLRGSVGSVQVFALARETDRSLRIFLATHGLAVDSVLSLGDTPTKFVGTPTVVLVDSTGTIRRLWLGRLPSTEAEDEVLTTLLRGRSWR
jgi:hypothetical protein